MNARNFRIFILCPLIFLVIVSCNSNRGGKFVASSVQFLNSSFEQSAGSDLPTNWKLVPTAGYTVSPVDDVKYLGDYSLKMVGNPTDATAYMNISQILSVSYKQVKRIRVNVYIKTEQLKGNVVLWYNIFGAKNKEIDFGNSESFGIMATGTTDWQKYALDIIVNKDAKELKLGAYVRGTGTVWFDDFTIEEYEGATNQATPEVVKLNKEFIDIVKKSSIYKDSID